METLGSLTVICSDKTGVYHIAKVTKDHWQQAAAMTPEPILHTPSVRRSGHSLQAQPTHACSSDSHVLTDLAVTHVT
jgi:hypothetical protein